MMDLQLFVEKEGEKKKGGEKATMATTVASVDTGHTDMIVGYGASALLQ